MLSICIPTHNRFRFLEFTLCKLFMDFPQAEIIVSDNDSRDDTRTVQLKRIKYIKQPKNIGAFPNMLAALKAAEGKYAMYCADDDYLIPDQVEKAIAYMDAHPEVVAYCAPCQIWDEVNQKPFWNAFTLPGDRMFGPSDGMDLFNLIIQFHVWPEHMIYRVPVPIKQHSLPAYWAFADIPDLLSVGALYFAPEPFYRNVLVHPVGERLQLGNQQCLTHFDHYRAGLEVMACKLFGDSLPYATRAKINEMISAFICTRLDTAARLHERAGNTAEAQMYRQRIAIASPVRDKAA